jgi:hypothetical protein
MIEMPPELAILRVSFQEMKAMHHRRASEHLGLAAKRR